MKSRDPENQQPYTGDTLPLPAARGRPLAAPGQEGPAPRAPRPPTRRPVPPPEAVPVPPPAHRRASSARRPVRSRPLPRSGTPGRAGILRRILRRVAVAVVLLAIAAIAGLLIVQQQVARAMALADVRADRPSRGLLVAPMNILLAGVDSRPDHPEEGIRSDSLLLLHLDPAGGWANLLSIPRDSYTLIPDHGEDKINAAFAQGYNQAEQRYGARVEPIAGGAALAAETVENFLGMRRIGERVDYVATVNFDGFAAMIDALGGIEVDVPRRIVDDAYPTPDFGTTTIVFEPGQQRLDGQRALQYVRTRHADSDFGRAQRQQQVLGAMSQALREKSWLQRPFVALRLLRSTGKAIRTTLPAGRPDALLLGLMLLRIDPASDLGNYRINPEDVPLVAEYGSSLVWEPAGVQRLLQQTLARPQPAPETATIQVLNSAQVQGLAGRVTERLQTAGLTTEPPATGEPAEQSHLIDYTGKPQTVERLRRELGAIPVEQGSAADAPPGVDIVVILGADYDQYVETP